MGEWIPRVTGDHAAALASLMLCHSVRQASSYLKDWNHRSILMLSAQRLLPSMLWRTWFSLRNSLYSWLVNWHPCHYRWPGWIERMEKAGLTRSMSKKGCSPDNSACEGFFGRIKNEMFYNRSWADATINEFIEILDRYIHWYAEKRIKVSLGGLSPLQYRKAQELAA